jgi:hypothetical protein
MHTELTIEQQDFVISKIKEFLKINFFVFLTKVEK